MGIHELNALLMIAAGAGFVHVIFGPDHYLPFIVMAKAGGWSRRKTFFITFLSGIAHIFSSALVAVVGIMLGMTAQKLGLLESFRGDLSAWLLIAFGLAYGVWGLRKAYQEKNSTKAAASSGAPNLTPWVLFTVFVLGPCEPMIPIAMSAFLKGGFAMAVWASIIFGSVTIVTMLGIVFVGSFGFSFLPWGRFERFAHALAGFTICLCGLAVKFLGL